MKYLKELPWVKEYMGFRSKNMYSIPNLRDKKSFYKFPDNEFKL